MSDIKRLFEHIIARRAESSPVKILGKSWLEMADEYGLNQDHPDKGKAVKDRWGSFKKTQRYRDLILERESVIEGPSENFEQDESDNSMTTISRTEFLYTEEDHIKFFKIDTEIWEVDRQITNSWGQKADVQLKQRKIWWRRKEETLKELKQSLASQIHIPEFKQKKMKRKGSLMVEMMITDHHLGKYGFDTDTMDFVWSLKEAGKAYSDVIDDFISRLDFSEISEFTLPTGNDLLNIDSPANTTTKGTPQMAPIPWETIFRYSKNLVIAAAEKLAKIAPVNLVMVPGNHDRNSVWSLGEVMDAYFKQHPNVRVMNKTIKRPHIVFGDCLVVWTHSDGINKGSISNIPATEFPEEFGRTKYRAVHCGHLHKNEKKMLLDQQVKDEVRGVEVEICPSLCPSDRWHYQKFYVGNQRRSKAFVWHKKNGLVGEMYYSLR